VIYKFKSQAEGDVIMLEINGDQMLTIIGRTPSPQGVITPEQMPAAIQALETTIVAHEAVRAHQGTGAHGALAVVGDSVQLRQRAEPFIGLLKGSLAAGKAVVWGV
jgi:hypothetical protein